VEVVVATNRKINLKTLSRELYQHKGATLHVDCLFGEKFLICGYVLLFIKKTQKETGNSNLPSFHVPLNIDQLVARTSAFINQLLSHQIATNRKLA
jgi:hypothetical protein